jgi:hypothetical protein
LIGHHQSPVAGTQAEDRSASISPKNARTASSKHSVSKTPQPDANDMLTPVNYVDLFDRLYPEQHLHGLTDDNQITVEELNRRYATIRTNSI